MMINLDTFFVQALNEAGYDLDFKRLKELYQQSRRNPECLARKARNISAALEYEERQARVVANFAAMEAEYAAREDARKQKAREQAKKRKAKKAASLAPRPAPEEAGQERLLSDDLPPAA